MFAQIDWDGVLNPGNLSMLVPIVAMIVWAAAKGMKHRERMAMIEKGMNPDAIPPSEERKRL